MVYVFGNHDHAMVNPRVQARLVDILNGAGDVGAGSPEKLSFGFYHEDPELRAYAEHGNQFSGEESAFRDPADWTEEALGYYVLRFAWNRYQNEHNVVAPSTGAKLSLMFRLLFRQGSPEAIKVPTLVTAGGRDRFVAPERPVPGASGQPDEPGTDGLKAPAQAPEEPPASFP